MSDRLQHLSESCLDQVGCYDRRIVRKRFFEAWGHECCYCGAKAYTLDHVLAKTNGGFHRRGI